MPRLLIHDGYDCEATIGPAHGFPSLRIRFRPATDEEVSTYRRTPAIDGAAESKLRVEFIKAHLISWDAETVDSAGKTIVAEINADTIKRVPYPYLAMMIDEIALTGKGSESVKN